MTPVALASAATALAWRSWASLAGQWAAEFGPFAARLAAVWRGTAATAAATRVTALRRALQLFRVLCWEADQALSELAAALSRAPGSPAAPLAAAARRLGEITEGFAGPAVPAPFGVGALPSCAATPAEVRRWWAALGPERQRGLVAAEPLWLGALDGVPAGARDAANRLLLDEHLRLGDPPPGLRRLAGRLEGEAGPRAYLLKIDPGGDGRVVVALGDPDRAAYVLTHVPGMTADLRSHHGELERAERVAVHAARIAPGVATSAVMWLDYDAPDFVDEAASARPAEAGAAGLRRFQDGLTATHLDGPGHRTVLGHSYGSLVVGTAARTPGLAVDDVVFVGSPGVGVSSAADLRLPPGSVWATTSLTDVIQYSAIAPRSLPGDLLLAGTVPGLGALLAFGLPEDDLWFGRNPADTDFGARVFSSQPGGGHLGYWDPGGRALDGITRIAVDGAP